MILHSEMNHEVCNLPIEAVGGHSLVNEMPLPSKVKRAVQLRGRKREGEREREKRKQWSLKSYH